MKSELRPYPEYKDSGLPWLGRVPAHWDVMRCKYLFREVDDRSKAGEETHLSMSQQHGLIPSKELDGRRLHSESYIGGKLCQTNDLVLNRLKAHLGVFAHARQPGLVSPDYTVLRPMNGDDVVYFELVFKTPACVAELRCSTKGIVEGFWRLYTDDLYNIRVPVPPKDERDSILGFVRALDTKVRRFIRNRRRVIEVLSEQKQAIINRAVTRGLDPNVRLKPSGIDWLGDIPEHWKVRKLRMLFRLHGSGTTPSGDSYYGGGVPWVMTGDLKDKVLTTTQRTVTLKALEDVRALRMYPAGSLLVAMYGATIGKTGVLSMDACTNQACCVLAEPRPDFNVRFLQAFVIIARPQLVQQSYGGGQPNINSEIVRSQRIPLPPRAEQDSIVDAIAQHTGTIDTAIERAQREIDLIREYRTRLIADVVTGKVDVRRLAPTEQLPGDESIMDDELTEGIDPEEMPGDDETEPIEEATDADD